MKEVTVDISKTYALRSETGGEVMDANSKLLETLEANKQKHMTAQESVWLVPDDCKVTKANFKHALAALGLLGGGDSLPAGYTRVEYLERKRGTSAWIDTKLSIIHLSFRTTFAGTDRDAASGAGCMLFGVERIGKFWYGVVIQGNTVGNGYLVLCPSPDLGNIFCSAYDNNFGAIGIAELNYVEGFSYIKGEKQEKRTPVTDNTVAASEYLSTGTTAGLFSRQAGGIPAAARVYSFYAHRNGVPAANFIPALDSTGAPCMFDTVTRTPFYNMGTDDFLYPGKEETATTYSLRRPRMYAQMTPHGIRRLYHVPKGYNGTPEEYAAENGFKVLVETEQPAEGYWVPVWHEREDCIELEWVETEPPAEQELLTEIE